MENTYSVYLFTFRKEVYFNEFPLRNFSEVYKNSHFTNTPYILPPIWQNILVYILVFKLLDFGEGISYAEITYFWKKGFYLWANLQSFFFLNKRVCYPVHRVIFLWACGLKAGGCIAMPGVHCLIWRYYSPTNPSSSLIRFLKYTFVLLRGLENRALP